VHHSTGCPTRYRTRHFFINFTNNEDIATRFEADLPHCVRDVKEKNVLLFKFSCNAFIDVRILKEMPGSVASGTPCVIHIENPTRCKSVSTFYFIFVWSSTCFGRHTAHHQEPKTALAASGFAYVESCWTCSCWTLTASSNYTANNLPRMQNQKLLVQF